MSKYSFELNGKSVRIVINSLCDNPNLNNWEKGFIKNIKQHYITENKFMSDGQYEKLSQLWKKY